MTRKAINNLNWHDGVLLDVTFAMSKKGKSSVELNVLLYGHEHARERSICHIKCDDVTRFNSTLDARELNDNLRAGNISNGYLKGDTIWVYFVDGLIEIHANRFRLIQRSA